MDEIMPVDVVRHARKTATDKMCIRDRFYYMGIHNQEKEAHIMEFLKIENLCKVYGKDENQITALDHVSLTIEKGEFVAVIG